MAQIVWAMPSGQIAITTLVEATDAQAEAKKLLKGKMLPKGWVATQFRDDDSHVKVDYPMLFAGMRK